ncbi:MAG TPA: hypothetical protein PKE04_11280 [Clostridia bacterium]|nr:hypothetical protein [Clostridia bacterium]
MNGALPTREELIRGKYPSGQSVPWIPMGNPQEERRRSNPDVVVYRPKEAQP